MKRLISVSAALLLAACGQDPAPVEAVDIQAPAQETIVQEAPAQEATSRHSENQIDRFADIQVLRYEVPGFDQLSLQEKKLVYYLSQSAMQSGAYRFLPLIP